MYRMKLVEKDSVKNSNEGNSSAVSKRDIPLYTNTNVVDIQALKWKIVRDFFRG